MANSIVPFEFESHEIRVTYIDKAVFWVVADVCTALGIVNSRDVFERIPADWKGVASIYTPGGNQDMQVVSEAGLYELVFASRKESAKRFRRWVFEEVLPSIRKNGKYELSPETVTPSLPPADIRIVNLHSALTDFGIDLTNPRFKQSVQDLVMDKIIGATSTLAPVKEVWIGVAEKAERMGYQISLVTRHRSQLGRYVASQGLTSRKEDRLCNGTQRPINLYLDCAELESAISEFMDAKVLATVAD